MDARAKGKEKLALLPVGGVNVPAAEGQQLLTILESELRLRRLRIFGIGVMPSADCDDACLVAMGRRAKARRLLRLEVGALGSTFVLRLTLYDLKKGARQGSWQEVLDTLSEERTRPALSRMINGFARLPEPKKAKAWYSRWWIWTAAAAVAVAGTAMAIGFSSAEAGPDHVIVPPKP